MMIIVATTSLPAVERPNADRWNAAHSRQHQTNCHYCCKGQLMPNIMSGMQKVKPKHNVKQIIVYV